jgi:hypothetical protein
MIQNQIKISLHSLIQINLPHMWNWKAIYSQNCSLGPRDGYHVIFNDVFIIF